MILAKSDRLRIVAGPTPDRPSTVSKSCGLAILAARDPAARGSGRPLLLLVVMRGDKDDVVPVSQSVKRAEAPRRAGVEVTLEIYKGSGRGGQAFNAMFAISNAMLDQAEIEQTNHWGQGPLELVSFNAEAYEASRMELIALVANWNREYEGGSCRDGDYLEKLQQLLPGPFQSKNPNLFLAPRGASIRSAHE